MWSRTHITLCGGCQIPIMDARCPATEVNRRPGSDASVRHPYASPSAFLLSTYIWISCGRWERRAGGKLAMISS